MPHRIFSGKEKDMLKKINGVFLFIFLIKNIYASPPSGSIVFDPSNFKTAVESLATFKQQIKTSRKAVAAMADVSGNISSLRKEMSEIYNSTFGVLGKLKELQKEIEKPPAAFQKILDDFKKNSECVFGDIDAYMKAENLWNAKYFYGHDPKKVGEGLLSKKLGFNNNIDSREQKYKTLAQDPKRGLFVKEREHNNIGTNSMTGLVHSNCGLTRTSYHDAWDRLNQERFEFMRVTARAMRSVEERKKEMRDWQILADRVSGKDKEAQDWKASIDTQMMLQWQMIKILTRIDKNIEGIYLYGTGLKRKQDQNVKNLLRAAKNSLTKQQIREGRQRMPDTRGTGTPHFDAWLEERKKSRYYKKYDSGPLFR